MASDEAIARNLFCRVVLPRGAARLVLPVGAGVSRRRAADTWAFLQAAVIVHRQFRRPATQFAKSLARGEPNREKIAWTVLRDKVREMV